MTLPSILLLGLAAVAPVEAIPHPDLSGMDAAVEEQLRAQRALLEDGEAPEHDATLSSERYGRMGLLYQIYDLHEAAWACYERAARLAPTEFRWPYFLGRLQQSTGHLEPAIDSYRLALEARPGAAAALLWMARAQRDLNRPDDARATFEKVLARDPSSVPALFGLGQIALARGDHEEAVRRFEAALRAGPDAPILHYNLGMAHRGRNEMARAREHLRKASGPPGTGFDPLQYGIEDPLTEAMRDLATGTQAHRNRGTLALRMGHVDAAVESFRKALESDPTDPLLHWNLGVALEARDDLEGAMAQYSEVVRNPSTEPAILGSAHLELGKLLERGGSRGEAAKHYSAALQAAPDLPDANSRLARLLMKDGEHERALEHYRRALESKPGDVQLHFWRAMALVRLHRHAEARARLEDGLRLIPEDRHLTHTLARLLASSPEDRVRDGARALGLMRRSERAGALTLGEAQTLAMALAETGDFAEAIVKQEQVLVEARRRDRKDLLPSLERDRTLYRGRTPSRVPWPDDDPIFVPPDE